MKGYEDEGKGAESCPSAADPLAALEPSAEADLAAIKARNR